jgi:two-component system, OmpR family, phosphate regulon sensor histidine kinase PhoR
MARPELSLRRVASALTIVAALPLVVLAALVVTGALGAWPAILAAAVIVVGLAFILRAYLSDVASAGAYVDALARGEDADFPALDHPGQVPELAVAITHLKNSWEKRRKSLEAVVSTHETVLDSLPDPLLRLDAGRNVIAVNTAAKRLLGQNLAGRDLASVIRTPALLEAVQRVLSDNVERDTEVQFAITDRVVSHYAARIARLPHTAEDGTVAILALYDLTAIRRAEQLRVDFVANASHELRTPLAVLLGCLDTLQGPAREDVAARERFIGEMRAQATRMSRLVGDLLSLSRIELDEHRRPDTTVELGDIVRRVAEYMKVRAVADKVEIALAVPETPMRVIGDEEQLTQLFQNLIDNAIKYGGKKSTVTVTAREALSGFPAEMPDTRRAYAVAIIDQGEGIPAADLPRLTERFYRVDKARSRELGGTGLGLAIVKHILNRHRGALAIDSTPGQGSTFTAFLPIP